MSEEAGYSYVDRLTQLEEDLFAQGQYIKEDSPFYRMSQFKKPQPEAMELSRKALLMLEAARFLKTQLVTVLKFTKKMFYSYSSLFFNQIE